MNIEYSEKQEKAIQQYCQRNSINEADLKAKIEDKYAALVASNELVVEDDPEATHERRMARAIRAGQGYFRKFLRKLGKAKPGMLICRHRTIGFDQFQINIAKRYVDEHGEEKAIADGYLNEAGKYLYTSGGNKGKPVGKPKSFTHLTGYTKTTDAKGNNYYDLRCFIVREDEIHKPIPMCQYSKIAAGEGKSPKENYPHSDDNVCFYNGGVADTEIATPYDEDAFLDIINTWNEVIDEMHFCNNFNELLDYGSKYAAILGDKNDKHAYDFCIVPGICSEILVNDKNKDEDDSLPKDERDWHKTYMDRNVGISIIDPITYDMHDISCFVSYDDMKGLAIDDGMQGLFVLQAYKKEGDSWCRWHLGGFLPVDDVIDLGEFLNNPGEE